MSEPLIMRGTKVYPHWQPLVTELEAELAARNSEYEIGLDELRQMGAENNAFRDVCWAIHNTAREQGGTLTVIGTAEYIAMLALLNTKGE